MTELEIKLAIAKDQGYKGIRISRTFGSDVLDEHIGRRKGDHYSSNIPNYTKSLDDIREAFVDRFKDKSECVELSAALRRIQANKGKWFFQLTALDWCEAYLETLQTLEPYDEHGILNK